jgi:hypothetical protein
VSAAQAFGELGGIAIADVLGINIAIPDHTHLAVAAAV